MVERGVRGVSRHHQFSAQQPQCEERGRQSGHHRGLALPRHPPQLRRQPALGGRQQALQVRQGHRPLVLPGGDGGR